MLCHTILRHANNTHHACSIRFGSITLYYVISKALLYHNDSRCYSTHYIILYKFITILLGSVISN